MPESFPRWWFQRFFIFIPIWGNDPIWLIFFKWVANHQLVSRFRNLCQICPGARKNGAGSWIITGKPSKWCRFTLHCSLGILSKKKCPDTISIYTTYFQIYRYTYNAYTVTFSLVNQWLVVKDAWRAVPISEYWYSNPHQNKPPKGHPILRGL